MQCKLKSTFSCTTVLGWFHKCRNSCCLKMHEVMKHWSTTWQWGELGLSLWELLKEKCAVCSAPHKAGNCSWGLKSGVDKIPKIARWLEKPEDKQCKHFTHNCHNCFLQPKSIRLILFRLSCKQPPWSTPLCSKLETLRDCTDWNGSLPRRMWAR